MQAQNINDVISRLEIIIDHSIRSNSRAGYFAALYYKVTCRVRDGIRSGEFEDGKRMEQFDVIFANRYLAAYDQWADKKPISSLSWKIAFETLNKPTVLALQHLLLGMNAHINLDLGVAVVELATLQNQPLENLHNDFNTINTILSALTYEVINDLTRFLHCCHSRVYIQKTIPY